MADATPSLFDRIDFAEKADPSRGVVQWSPIKSLWWSSMLTGWVVVGSSHFSFSALCVFIVLCGLILCLGHSIGMHRKLIHDSFECPDWLEKVLVYLGTLVGLGGPFTMMYTHDIRDWAQRNSRCHPFLSHQNSILKDFWWQLHCKLHLEKPPQFVFPSKLTSSKYYKYLQYTSMLQQIPLGFILYALGGWGWIAWGIFGRVTASIFGHWIIGYFAHNDGHRDWHVHGAAVQGHNVRGFGLITFGECWHNNHHAFPSSARLGLNHDQFDPGWRVLKSLEGIGLVRHLKEPKDIAERPELSSIAEYTVNSTGATRTQTT